ncbi:MAG: phosphodiesterase [Candidatus Baltobacteraceae bacterium]
MILAHLTDPHVTEAGRRYQIVRDTRAHLARAITRINLLAPRVDAVVLTGDLAQNGYPQQYARLRETLNALSVPYFAIVGNHDRREAFRRAFADRPWLPPAGDPLDYAVDDFPMRLIALDVVAKGSSGGHIDPRKLTWIAARLAEAPHRPTVFLMHQPPLRTGIRYMDAFGFVGMEAFGALVARYPNVVGVLCGHIHRTRRWAWSGTTVIAARSSAPQVVPYLFEGFVPAWVRLWRPGFLVHTWDGAHLTTRTILT